MSLEGRFRGRHSTLCTWSADLDFVAGAVRRGPGGRVDAAGPRLPFVWPAQRLVNVECRFRGRCSTRLPFVWQHLVKLVAGAVQMLYQKSVAAPVAYAEHFGVIPSGNAGQRCCFFVTGSSRWRTCRLQVCVVRPWPAALHPARFSQEWVGRWCAFLVREALSLRSTSFLQKRGQKSTCV